MDPRQSMGPSRPKSVKELVAQAQSFNFNPNIAAKYWMRSAETLYQEASFAIEEADYGRAYMMLYRHSILVLQYIPSHPHFKDPDNKKAYRPLSKRINRVIEELEELKPEIEHAYNEWERMAPRHKEEGRTSTSSRYAEYAARDPTLSGNARILDASEHQDLAVDLAQKELMRRDTARRATREAGIPDEETLSRRRGGTWEKWASQGRSGPGGDEDLRRQMEATRHTLDAARQRGHVERTAPVVVSQYQYPSISKSTPVEYGRDYTYISPSSLNQPARPPKEPPLPPRPDVPTTAPSLPRKVPLDQYQPLIPQSQGQLDDRPALPPKESIAAPPPPKKERVAFKPGAYLENGDPVRTIFLPRKLRQKFLDIAANHTRQGIEMCGILCGMPINNALFVRCLLIPDQKCTSDTCETENETDVFDYCIGEDLLVLGWIHTHPTQTCFMSSRDLHTQAGYQVMMPESVAIVCAPKFEPSYGIFRLTHPPGLDHILNCNDSGTFHQHSIDNIYREAEQPSGHVYESDKMEFFVKDLRTK